MKPRLQAASTWQAFFMDADGSRSSGGRQRSQRLCIYHPPLAADGAPADADAVRGAVVYLHPLAEEMNKARRMAALQSRALASAGFAVLQIDMLGCGDSSGDFGDANWADWLDDAERAAHWLQARHTAPLWLWGLRAGCLLAAAAADRLQAAGTACNLLFWQPPVNGKTLLQQFLRLKMAGDMLDGKTSGVTAALRAELDAGRGVDIAGYTLSAGLAKGLEQATLRSPRLRGRAIWLETSTRAEPALLPATQAAAAAWQTAGDAVQTVAVNGPAFWQTQEIEDAPALIDATTRAMQAPNAATPATVDMAVAAP